MCKSRRPGVCGTYDHNPYKLLPAKNNAANVLCTKMHYNTYTASQYVSKADKPN